MPTRDRIAEMSIRKAENSLAEAETLAGAGFFDGAVSRASAACVHVMNAAIALHGRPGDPEVISECVTAWASDGRLPPAAAVFFQVATMMRMEADDTCNFASHDHAENSIAGARHFFQIVKRVAGIIHGSSGLDVQPAIPRRF